MPISTDQALASLQLTEDKFKALEVMLEEHTLDTNIPVKVKAAFVYLQKYNNWIVPDFIEIQRLIIISQGQIGVVKQQKIFLESLKKYREILMMVFTNAFNTSILVKNFNIGKKVSYMDLSEKIAVLEENIETIIIETGALNNITIPSEIDLKMTVQEITKKYTALKLKLSSRSEVKKELPELYEKDMQFFHHVDVHIGYANTCVDAASKLSKFLTKMHNDLKPMGEEAEKSLLSVLKPAFEIQTYLEQNSPNPGSVSEEKSSINQNSAPTFQHNLVAKPVQHHVPSNAKPAIVKPLTSLNANSLLITQVTHPSTNPPSYANATAQKAQLTPSKSANLASPPPLPPRPSAKNSLVNLNVTPAFFSNQNSYSQAPAAHANRSLPPTLPSRPSAKGARG